MSRTLTALLAALSVTLVSGVEAQEWPARPVTMGAADQGERRQC